MSMIDILHKFIRAEHTGNWELHLQSIFHTWTWQLQATIPTLNLACRIYNRCQTSKLTIPMFSNIKVRDYMWSKEATISGQAFHLTLLSFMRSLKTSWGLTQGCGMTENQHLLDCVPTPLLMLMKQWQLGHDIDTNEWDCTCWVHSSEKKTKQWPLAWSRLLSR